MYHYMLLLNNVLTYNIQLALQNCYITAAVVKCTCILVHRFSHTCTRASVLSHMYTSTDKTYRNFASLSSQFTLLLSSTIHL